MDGWIFVCSVPFLFFFDDRIQSMKEKAIELLSEEININFVVY